MTLPIWTTNPNTSLSTTQIQSEFGGEAPTSMSEYFRGGQTGYVTNDRVGFPNGVSTPIPAFGNPLAISNFYGASSVSYTITTNKSSYNEGETMSISITAPANNGTILYWTIEDVTTGISISPTTLPTGIKGGSQAEVFQQQLTASGGTGPYTFSIVVGSPPAGISLSSSGLLSGFPTSAGVTTFTVQAIDSQGNGGVQQYSLSVLNVTYLPATLPNGTQNSAYSQQLSVSGGTAPYVYTLLGTLPDGITLLSSGLLSGTPTVTGTFNTSIRVIFNGGAMGDPGITISYQDWVISGPVSISVSPSTLPTGAINTSYSQQLSASGGTSPYTYSTSSSLPTGVTLSSSGLLSGTPTQSGTYNLTIQVNDGASHTTNVQRTLNVGSVNISLSPSASNVLTGTQNGSFTQQFTASGGTAPYTFSAIGQLPPGLSLTGGGLLSGTPTSSGTFTFTISALDANTNSGTATYSLNVSGVTISISPSASTVLTGTQNVSFSQAFTASGGTPSYTFSAVGQLPPGLSLVGGLLLGTPTSSGTFSFTIRVVDANTNSGTATYSLAVGAAEAPPTLSVMLDRGNGGGGTFVFENDNPAYIGIQIYNEYPVGHTFNTGDYDRVSWQISGTGITAGDFNNMELYSGPTPDNDRVILNPLTTLSGTIDLKYFAGGAGRSMLGVIYLFVKADSIPEVNEGLTFTVTFGNQSAYDTITLADS